MNDSHQKLKMSFDPNTIEHLGVKMYSRIPSAIAELIANAYDAGARRVDILLYDTGEEKSIVVQDDGYGMTFDEINSNFLRIGRNRREEGATKTLCGTRKATGKKGLGKLGCVPKQFEICYDFMLMTIHNGGFDVEQAT